MSAVNTTNETDIYAEIMRSIEMSLSQDVSSQYFDRIEKSHLDSIISKMDHVLRILHDNDVSDDYTVMGDITYLELQMIAHILRKERNKT